jgi:hypothetical protein
LGGGTILTSQINFWIQNNNTTIDKIFFQNAFQALHRYIRYPGHPVCSSTSPQWFILRKGFSLPSVSKFGDINLWLFPPNSDIHSFCMWPEGTYKYRGWGMYLIPRERQDFQTSRITFPSNILDWSRKWTSTITETATPTVTTIQTDYSIWGGGGFVEWNKNMVTRPADEGRDFEMRVCGVIVGGHVNYIRVTGPQQGTGRPQNLQNMWGCKQT